MFFSDKVISIGATEVKKLKSSCDWKESFTLGNQLKVNDHQTKPGQGAVFVKGHNTIYDVNRDEVIKELLKVF